MQHRETGIRLDNVRTLFAFLVICVGAGCSGSDTGARRELDEARATIRQLNEALADAETEREAALARLADQHAGEMSDLETSLRREVNELSRTIARLRAERPAPPSPAPPAAEPAVVPAPAPPAAPAISVFQGGDAGASDFTIVTTGDDGPPFPLAVENVRARSVVVGKHKTTRVVETDVLVKDSFGREVPLRTKEDIERDEYDTVVEFRVSNLDDRPAHVVCRAGREELAFEVAPGASLDQRVGTHVGASLQVRANGVTRSFEVPYSKNPR